MGVDVPPKKFFKPRGIGIKPGVGHTLIDSEYHNQPSTRSTFHPTYVLPPYANALHEKKRE